MTNFASRLLVAVIGLPLVLGMLWLGGWWLFTLVAVASCVAVHEFVTTARPLRPHARAYDRGRRLDRPRLGLDRAGARLPPAAARDARPRAPDRVRRRADGLCG